MEPRIKPDYIIVPYQLYEAEGIQDLDRSVYGVVYWFQHMRDGICKASNETIAGIVNAKVRSVQNALTRLERGGFVKRTFRDKMNRHRDEIEALVAFKYSNKMKTTEKPKKEKTTKEVAVKKETPGDFARRFFIRDKDALKDVISAMLLGSHGRMKEDYLLKEINEFILYWTEPTKSGRQVRWETHQTFEIKRRLYTWLTRPWKNKNTTSKAGAGKVI